MQADFLKLDAGLLRQQSRGKQPWRQMQHDMQLQGRASALGLLALVIFLPSSMDLRCAAMCCAVL